MSIEIVQFNNYVKPLLSENKSKNWVLNGVNNSFYQYVIDRYNGSVTNATIINSYNDLVYGRGLLARDSSRKVTQWAALSSILKPSELKKIISDFNLFGEAAMQIVKTKDKKEVAGIYHLPKNYVVPSLENEDGEIESYWYSKNFTSNKIVPVNYPSFGTSNEAIEIYVIKPYKAGQNYFAYPDYFSAISYAELEEEITNFYLNAIRKGLSAGFIIGIPNGIGKTPEEKDKIEKGITRKLTGSKNALEFVLDFHDQENDRMTVENFPTNENIHKQWSYLSAEARQQLMTGHKVTSPMLFGIKDNTGFGNNADELDTAERQLMKRVVAPKQQCILDAIKDVLELNNISLDLYFLPLTEVKDNNISLSDHEKKKLSDKAADLLIELGQDEFGAEWELFKVEKVEFTSTGVANPNSKDNTQDGELFKSRYRYKGERHNNSRSFCVKMLAANKLYRLKDINLMSEMIVNEGWGPNGSDTYDILLYKGGGNCKHYWERESYRLKADVNNPNAEQITPADARKAGEILPTVDGKAYIKPIDMPNNGFLNK